MKSKIKIPEWPLIHPETLFSLADVYFGKYWSWYGKYERRFLKKFLTFLGVKLGFLTSSGTSALETALKVLGIKEGDEVIVPAYTWISTATAVVSVGAVPVFVDIDEKTLCISPKEIEKAITEKTRAIIPVHLFSALADMDLIIEIAKKHNLYVLEDSAHAIGANYSGSFSGTMGHIGAFSFQQSKLLSSGEGGMCITRNREFALRLDKILHIGYSVFKDNKEQVIPTKNLMTEFQAAVLDNQMNYLKNENYLRADNAKYLESLLKGVSYIRFQETSPKTTERTYYKFVFLIDSEKLKEGYSLQNIIVDLQENGLPAENTYGDVVFRQYGWQISEDKYRVEPCPVAEKTVQKEIICFPHTLLIADKKTLKRAADIIIKVTSKYFKEAGDNV